jgi:hypothetical protein
MFSMPGFLLGEGGFEKWGEALMDHLRNHSHTNHSSDISQ